MRKIRFTPAAKEHLKDIWKYSFETWGEAKADSYLMDIETRLKSLLANPELGRSRPEIKPGYHSISVNKHVVFYLISQTHIDIIGVLHQRMDIKSNLPTE
ncbi:type II toxin-antitoxin system RelE/ParE family toxin [Maridesulfovibrio sp.]|uniref:type II toxin-antitoxin system RelE/ParE family toxin n=1 Tax=Maridesulfovibrio sp. TaxID=2795000 RepID=UPI002AA7C1EF|nr:type II toxin-antitoxin system RelE/ParE family toxin [Maridesulfovibrio sp.]